MPPTSAARLPSSARNQREPLPPAQRNGAAEKAVRKLTIEHSALVAEYLERTRFVHLLRFDHAGVILSANDAMARHLGSSGASLRGRAIFDFLTDPDAALIRARLEARFSASDPTALNFCDADGAPFTLLAFLTLSDDGGVLIGEPTYEDEQRLHRQLLEVNEELASLARSRHRSRLLDQQERLLAEADNRAKDDAMAVIAHELRQPLNGAMAALGLLKKDPAGAATARALVILERQVRQMSTIVEDLLHASEVMRGEFELARQEVDLRQLVREAVDTIDLSARERRQALTLSVPEEPVPVRVDISRIGQVFMNVLTNASKYTPEEGAIAVTVDITGGGAARISVRDTGKGVEAADLTSIFSLFVRTTRGGNGLGIGLAVARRLVDMHGGTLTANSDGPGLGSEFIVTLPLDGGSPVASPGAP